MTTTHTRRAALALVAALAVGGAACGGDETSLEDLVQSQDGTGADGGSGASSSSSPGGGTIAPPVTAPPVSPPPVTAGSGDVFQLEVGQCLDDFATSASVTDVPTVPCDQPHSFEVYATFDLPGDVFPGEAAVQEQAGQGCLQRFEGFVGLDYQSSVLDINFLYPQEQGWNQIGDREVICFVFRLDGTQVTGSLQGTAQ